MVRKGQTMDKKIRIGIIGTGGIAHAHMASYVKRNDVEIVALADIVPGKAEAFAKEFGVETAKYYTSHEDLLNDESLNLDGVSICTYNRQHAIPTIMALNKGINVLVEKPMAVTLDEAVAMAKAEKESGKILSVGFQPRFDANMQMIKALVESGELGKVYYIQTGGGRRRGIPGSTFIYDETAGVGALGDIGCYSLDMVLNAIGYPKPLTVSGFKTDYFGKKDFKGFSVDDFAGGLIRLEGDIVLDFRISWALNVNTPGDTLILGTEAGLRIPSTDCWNGSVGGEMTVYRTVAGSNVEYKVPLKPGCDLWERKIGSFINAIRTNGPSPIPSWQIVRNQAIIDGIVRSSEIGREIEIEIPEI